MKMAEPVFCIVFKNITKERSLPDITKDFIAQCIFLNIMPNMFFNITNNKDCMISV